MSNCFTPLRGRRMRLTRVDNQGRPAYGTCAFVSTKGYLTVKETAQVESGQEIIVKAADGSLCVNEKDVDQTKWYDIEMTFCQVDVDLVTMINPTWTKLIDYRGRSVGWAESLFYDGSTGFAVELWADVTNYVVDDPHADGAWVYFLNSYVVGGTIGDITVENNALSFTLKGFTRKGSQWGRGPYAVELNAPAVAGINPLPGPLLVPVDPDEPRRIMLTGVKPPDALCGCQPLSAPNGPALSVAENTTDATRYTAEAYAAGAGGTYMIDWGDGTTPASLAGDTTASHSYSAAGAGAYYVSVWDTHAANLVSVRQVVVPFAGATPPRLFIADDITDTTARRSIVVHVDNHTNGAVVVDFGDGSNASNPGDGTTATNHTYTAPGTYTVTAVDTDTATLRATEQVEVPFGQQLPTVTVTKDTAVGSGQGVEVTVNNHGNGSVVLDWGDTTQEVDNLGDGVAISRHTYASAGTFTVTVTDPQDYTATVRETVTVPMA